MKVINQVNRTASALVAILMLLGTLTLAGCGSSSPIRLHTIEAAVSTVRDSDYAGPPLQVRSVTVPVALDRTELLREVTSGEFEVREFDHWAAPLPQLVRQALSEDLSARLSPGRMAFLGASWPQPLAYLDVDIISFEVRNGTATMRVSWKFFPRLPKDDPAPSAGSQLRLQTTAPDSAGGTSQAFSTLLGQLADEVVSRFHKL